MIKAKSNLKDLDRFTKLHSTAKLEKIHSPILFTIPSLGLPSDDHSPEDLTESLKFLLVIGRLIGVLPLKGVRSGKSEKLNFRWTSFPTFASVLISITLGINLIAGLFGFFKSRHEDAKSLAFNCHMALFYGTALFIYIYLAAKSHNFIVLLRFWQLCRFKYPLLDKSLRRDVIITTSVVYLSIILENATWHIKHFMTRDENGWTDTARISKQNMTSLEAFYATSEPDWSSQVQYHPVLVLFLLVTNKWALYSWNFVEILLIVLSRAVYFKFHALTCAVSQDPDLIDKWKRLIADHSTMCEILMKFDRFLSPLVLLSFFNNIYNVCIHISLTLSGSEDATLIGLIYSTWSFLHLIIRFYIVCISASRINTFANEAHALLRKCPVELYSKEIKKYEKQLYYRSNTVDGGDGGIGLTGMGYFTITKPMMLKILGVIFTVEIVLLQNASTLVVKSD